MSKDEETFIAIYNEYYLPFKKPLEKDQLKYVLSRIIEDLPAKRDWLDPDIEKMARDLISKKSS